VKLGYYFYINRNLLRARILNSEHKFKKIKQNVFVQLVTSITGVHPHHRPPRAPAPTLPTPPRMPARAMTVAQATAAAEEARRRQYELMKAEFPYNRDDVIAIVYNRGTFPGKERLVTFKSFKDCLHGPPVMVAMHRGMKFAC
jgi:hypothetical protein